MKLIRNLVFPWILFFLAAVATIVLLGVKFTRVQMSTEQLYFGLGAGTLLCLMANINSLGNVGIWMSEVLPESLRYGSWRWIFRTIKAVAIGGIFWFVGQLSWIPLIWQAAILPGVLSIVLFVSVWSLIGPILKFSSNMSWSRAFSIILSLPVLLAVPLTALFVGQTMVSAYRSSRPELFVESELRPLPPPPLSKKELAMRERMSTTKAGIAAAKQAVAAKALTGPVLPKLDKRAQALKDIADSTGSCSDHDKEVQAALEPKGPEDLVFWGIKALKCTDIKSVVGLTKLSQIMVENPSTKVRAAAIMAMKKYGNENIKQISYLLVKRLTEREPSEVIEAAAAVLAPLGEDQQKWSTKRLKLLMDSPNTSLGAATSLIQNYSRTDLVADYVAENLAGPGDARKRAVLMICLLPAEKRSVAEPFVPNVVATIASADQNDPGVQALSCLGRPGFLAIREELSHPHRLDRTKAAKVFAQLNVKQMPESIETANACSQDGNEEVRQWCSRTLGEMGAPALPMILDLLKSNDKGLKEAGQNALQYFDDASAKTELQKIRSDNSGWMANNKKLQIAKAVGLALAKMQDDGAHSPPTPQSPIH